MPIITQVHARLVEIPQAVPPFNWRRGLPGSGGRAVGAWVSIETDSGHTGYAFASHGVIVKDLIERRVRSELVGQEALRREFLWERLWEVDRVEEFPIYLIGIVDVALWDIAGKVAGLPLHQLLGSYRDEIAAYASTTTFSSIDQFLRVADACLAAGFRAIKLHAFGDARLDAQLCARLRRHVGPDVELMYDGSAGFDLADAVYLGRALTDLEFSWYEEPMREFSVTAYKRLSERVGVPLLVAETSDGAHFNTADFISSGCAVGVRTSASHRAGVTGAMRTAHLAESFLLRAEVHGSGLVSRHLCMAIPNNTFYESFIRTEPIAPESLIDPYGMVPAPTGVGVGWETAEGADLPPGFKV